MMGRGEKRIVGERGDGGNWSVFNNRENGFPYFIYVVHYFYLDY